MFEICQDCQGIIDSTNNQCTCENKKNIDNSSLIEKDEHQIKAESIRTYQNFLNDVGKVINSNCVENHSNTPDFILADYLKNQLILAEILIKARDKWYSINPGPAWGGSEIIDNFHKVINQLEDMKKLQSDSLETNNYMVGYYNGIELALSMLKNKEPIFKTIPGINTNDIFHRGKGDEKNYSKHNE